MFKMAQRKTLLRALTSLSLSVLLIFTTIYNPINVEAKLENDTKIMSSQEGKEYTQFSSSTLVNNSTVNSSVYQDNISYTLNYSGIYQASKDFNVEQGYNGWYYTEKTESGYTNMAWDGVSAWKGTGSYCYIWANAQHSDINDSVRKWIAPYSGTVLITSNGNIRKSNTNGGDGVKARLYKNSGLLWESYIAGTDGVGVSFPPRVVEVAAGDAIYFEINKNGDINCDATIWDPVIEYKTGITYIYDNQNRLLKVLMNGNPLLRFEYDKCGNILKRYR